MDISPNKSEKEQVMDFVSLCLKHWYYFVISGLICGILGIIYLKIKQPVYAINAQVALRHDESLTGSSVSKTSNGILSAMGFGSGKENIEDEALKIGSQGNIKEVVKELDLNKIYKEKYFFGLFKENLSNYSPVLLSVNPVIPDTLTALVIINMDVKKDGSAEANIKWGKYKIGKFSIHSFPETIRTSVGELTFSLSPFYNAEKAPFSLQILLFGNDAITQIYRKIIDVDFYKKNSDLIDLSINSKNVNLAKQILLTAIDCYNKSWDKDKNFLYTQTIDYINRRLGITQQELADADRQIQEFKDKYKLTDIEADVKYYFTMSGEVQASLLQTESQLKLADIILNFVKEEDNRYSLVPYSLTTSDPSIAEVISKYNEEILRRNELRKSNAQSLILSSLESQLDSQRKNLILSLNNVKKGLQATLETIQKKEREIDKKIGNMPSVERDYVRLKRIQELQQTIYIFLLEKREETAVRAVSLAPKLKIIDEPYVVNKPVSPNMIKVAMVVLFFGGIFFPLTAIYSIPVIGNYLRRRKK
jgi:uncharacterized protein involved in exopolysaccharide biosynthesis